MILVFTRNVMTAAAIRSLSAGPDHRQVYVFDNRMAFLVCAIVCRQAITVIDTLDRETFGDVKWLAEKMYSRGIASSYYLVRTSVYSSYINMKYCIYTLSQLAVVIRKNITQKKTDEYERLFSLSDYLRHYLQAILHPGVYAFLLADTPAAEGDARERKRRLNIRYRIRHKLNLESRLEYSMLLSLIQAG